MTTMTRVSVGGIERRFSILLVTLGLVACGGKVDLEFTGAPPDSSNGGTGDAGGTAGMTSASCGDGVVDTGEECDDGAHAVGDGCDASCAVETGWTCTGTPSTCVKCGNGTVEAGEECDDGNSDNGDGCSKDCKIEGSCATPLPIALGMDKSVADGLTGSATGSTAAGDAGQVDPATCVGAVKVGGGADRIFEFDLPTAADVEVAVGSSFDAIVRIMTSPCDLKTQLPNGCVDGAAVAGEEHAVMNDAAAGKYYIVVDGKTAKQAGSFSVQVVARCPLSGLKIDRVILADPFRTTILNTNQCAVDLSRAGIYAQPEAADVPKTLPAKLVDPLKRLLLTSASPPPANTTYQGNIRYDVENYAGAFYLCRDQCDTANGTNVIDAFRWQGEKGPLSVAAPKSVLLTKDGEALTDRTAMSYFRVLDNGVYPNFSGDDFVGAYWVETFEDGSLSGWDPPTALFYKPKFESVVGTVGQFSLALSGGNPAMAVWNGPKHVFSDNSGTAAPIAPTYVSLRVRGSDKTVSHGWAFFGHQGTEVSGFGSYFRDNGSIGFGAPLPSVAVPYTIETWYLIEYQEFNYTNAMVGQTPPMSVHVYVDGKAKGYLPTSSKNVSQISLRSVAANTNFWIDQIIVR